MADSLSDPGRKRKRAEADLNALYARHLGRNSPEVERQEELLRDARAWAKAELKPTATEVRDVLELKERIAKKTWDEFVPKHPYHSYFQLRYREFEAALWEQGWPSLEDYAIRKLVTPASAYQAGAGTGEMTHGPSWEQLADQLESLKAMERLQARWYANIGSEDYGIWLIHPDGQRTLQVRATFSLIAAQIIEKLKIHPIPVPQSGQHSTHWADHCDIEENLARQAGRELDLSDAVPYGLETVDRDAVDPCTRAFLEMLRREDLAFQITANGTHVVNGQTYESVTGSIDDLCGAAAAHCKRRARDEIGARLASRLDNVGATPSSVDTVSGHAAASVLDLLQDGALGQPLPQDNDQSNGAMSDQLTEPSTEQDDGEAVAETASEDPDPDNQERANVRSVWLNQKLAQHSEWTSDTDIADNDGPVYNTIRRYRSGALSTRDLYVRRRLAKAFGCDIGSVPE